MLFNVSEETTQTSRLATVYFEGLAAYLLVSLLIQIFLDLTLSIRVLGSRIHSRVGSVDQTSTGLFLDYATKEAKRYMQRTVRLSLVL